MKLYLVCVFATIAFSFFPKDVRAFGCVGQNDNIVADVKIDKDASVIILTDLSKNSFYCAGDISSQYQDAIRIVPSSAVLNQAFTDAGYTGIFIDSLGQQFDFADSGLKCIWFDATCPVKPGVGVNVQGPLKLKIGLRKTGAGSNHRLEIAANDELARFTVQQRGVFSTIEWGTVSWAYRTFIIKLKSDLVMPAYTCSVDNPDNIRVELPSVDIKELRERGTGRYEGVSKAFNLNLSCEPQTSVDVQFDGDTINNYPDVLKNTNGDSSSVGIQVLYNDVPIVYGENKRVIDSATSNEVLSYKAYYYYSNGALNPGPVKSLATVTFDYK